MGPMSNLTWVRELSKCLQKEHKQQRSLQCFRLPMGTDLHDTDSCLNVSMQDGVKNGCRTSPPWQQAGMNVEYPTVSGHNDKIYISKVFIFRLIQCSLHTLFTEIYFHGVL